MGLSYNLFLLVSKALWLSSTQYPVKHQGFHLKIREVNWFSFCTPPWKLNTHSDAMPRPWKFSLEIGFNELSSFPSVKSITVWMGGSFSSHSQLEFHGTLCLVLLHIIPGEVAMTYMPFSSRKQFCSSACMLLFEYLIVFAVMCILVNFVFITTINIACKYY